MHAALVLAASLSLGRALLGAPLSGLPYLLLAGGLQFMDMVLGMGALQTMAAAALASPPLRRLFGWTTLFGAVIVTLVGLTTLGALLPLPWSRDFGSWGLLGALGCSGLALLLLIAVAAGYAGVTFYVSAVLLFASDARRRNDPLLRPGRVDDLTPSESRLLEAHFVRMIRPDPKPPPAPAPPPPPPPKREPLAHVGDRWRPEDHAIARSYAPWEILKVLKDRAADPYTVLGALNVALLISREVPPDLRAELKESVSALTRDPRMLESDPREGLPPTPLSEEAERHLRQWPRS